MTTEQNGIKGYSKSILDKFIVHVLWTIGITAGTSAVTFFISRKFQFSNLEVTLFITIIVFAIAAISYIIYRRNNKRLPQLPEIDPDFHIVIEERVHRWIDANNYTHKRRYSLRALKNNLSHYTDKFCWSGKDYVLTGEGESFTIVQEDTFENIYDVYRFQFRRKMQKGEINHVEASWKASGPAKPFFSTTIEEPTDFLLMSVMLYPGCGITSVNTEVKSHKGAKASIESKVEKLNSDGEFSWRIPEPKLLYHYEINWQKQ